jgi:hypothetical protein
MAGKPVSRILKRDIENTQVTENTWSRNFGRREFCHGSQDLWLGYG